MGKTVLKIAGALIAVLFILFLIGTLLPEEEVTASGDESLLHPAGQAQQAAVYGADDTWAVYWYLCGSDLESDGGAATIDLEELTAVDAPEHLRVVIQTGGANGWEHPDIDAEASQRFVYDENGLALVEEGSRQNMGDAGTLADFLTFCETEYPADHTALIFWNHGGGSAGGIAYDEQYDFDSLSLEEVAQALQSVYGEAPETPPLDLVGFDACLMATVDTAAALKGYAAYMVASQETEPATGWNYTGLMSAMAQAPGITAPQLGKSICDTYAAACQEEQLAGDITLSVVDLSRLDALLTAYHNAGIETLSGACASPSFLSSYNRNAKSAENYGGNTETDGYANMVDLGDLVRSNAALLPGSTQSVLDALADCVVYKVNGPYRAKAGGLSCYHAYDKDRELLDAYAQAAVSDSYVYLYEYIITGALSDAAREYIGSMEYQAPAASPGPPAPALPDVEEVAQLATINTLELEDYPVYVTDEGYAVLDLGPEIAAQLSGVYMQLTYVDYEEDIILLLGRDNDLCADWDAGVFEDNFRGVWGAIDGCFVYMEIIYEGEDYNLYTVPVLLNGEEYNLRVSYDYNTERYSILGARQGIENYGMSDRNLVLLQPGDVLTTLHYAQSLSGDDELALVPVDEITVSGQTSFHEADLGDGDFVFLFEMEDISGNYAFSQLVWITVEGEYIEMEAEQ